MPTSSDADEVRLRLRIEGRVQGVWFRGSARDEALRLGLLGWARNCPDGSVEILAQGAAARIEELKRWCQRGPSGAHVTAVKSQDEAPSNELIGFRVRYD